MVFELKSNYKPTGDQPEAIKNLVKNIKDGCKDQVMLGVTGSGKSLTYEQPVLVRNKVTMETAVVEIGRFIDRFIKSDLTFNINDTEVYDINNTVGYEVLSWNPTTCKEEFKDITFLTRHKSPEKLYTVRTSCGRETCITGDHNLWVLRNGSLKLIETAEATTTDYLPLPIKINSTLEPLSAVVLNNYLPSNTFCNIYDVCGLNDNIDFDLVGSIVGKRKLWAAQNKGEGLLFSQLAPVLNTKKSIPVYVPGGEEIPSHLQITPELLTFIGLFVAEGHATKGYLLISAHEEALKAILFDVINKLGLNGTDRRFNPGDIQISNVLWTNIIQSFCGNNAYTKRLPSWFMDLDNAQLSTILSAYFSGDGWVEKSSIKTSTASKQLASDLMYALLRFGIVARLSKKWKKVTGSDNYPTLHYEVSITGQEFLQLFASDIGFILKRKQIKLETILGKNYNTNVDLIPVDGNSIKKIRLNLNITQSQLALTTGVSRSFISLLESNKRKPSRNVYKKLVTALSIPEDNMLYSLGNTYWTSINQVIEGISKDEYVYDFSVADNETFLGGFGGMFLHNTFVASNVIAQVQKPTLVISHNKTLAAQLYQEFRDFFPNNAVEYFVSYYDYYQPESYLPSTDTYIEKDSNINEKIDKLRLSATTSLMTRKDVIVVASVSCIYNLGSPAIYSEMAIELRAGMKIRTQDILTRLSQINYERSDYDFKRGTYRVVGEVIDIFPAYMDEALRLEVFNNTLIKVSYFNPLTGDTTKEMFDEITLLYPAKHYITAENMRKTAVEQIQNDLQLRLKQLRDAGKQIEAYRLEQRTNYDLEMMQEIGYCKGIENYSRYFDGRASGSMPYTLMDFFPKDYLLVVDESHITVPQIRAMYNGDQARKSTLIDYGFRLPSALDNRPLNFNEFLTKLNQTLYVSATPNEWEIEQSENNITELLIRPTGILDPQVTILPTKGQIQDLLEKVKVRIARGERVLVTTLTKRMAEELSAFLSEQNIKVTYLHSDVDTLERTEILDDLRKGSYDVLVGINLLREGLDLPEVSLVVILDADKEGFLRSQTSLIQTMGRAARHILGEVVMYADNVTDSMKRAIAEVERRRKIQKAYNDAHGMVPMQIVKPIREKLIDQELDEEISGKTKKASKYVDVDYKQMPPAEIKKQIKVMEKEMLYEAEMLNFEVAASLRDKVRELKKLL